MNARALVAKLEADFRFVEDREARKLPVEGFPNPVLIPLRQKYRQA